MRERNLDLLRVIAAIMVILNHVASSYVTSNIDNPNLGFTIGNLYNSVSRTAVPIFVMLSGAFILDDCKNKQYRYFYKKIYNKIGIPLITWSIIYFIYSMLYEVAKGLAGEEGVSYISPLFNLLNGRPYYHFWYMYMILGLYLLSPILIRLKEDIGESVTFKLGIILTLIGMIVSLTSDLFWIISFIKYIGYYILGYSLRKYYSKNKIKPVAFAIGAVVSAILVFGGTEIIVRFKILPNNPLIFYGTLSPFIISGAICLYIVFLNISKVKANISNLADYTFFIYIVHPGILNVMDIFLIKVIHFMPSNPYWYIPLKTLLVFILSYFAVTGINLTRRKLNFSFRIRLN